MGEERKVYTIFVGNLEGKRSLGSPRHIWEDGIRMVLKKIGRGGVEWIQLAQDRYWWQVLVNVVMNLWVMARHKVSYSCCLAKECSTLIMATE
jgi:hypothetical protein